ncbi:MAG: alcohol dehydrogenase catalytic domain-containing protein [Nanoarchaeota archaeon]|nr:alcohol dehydrogenase catalytic domain-containing protein [Nanoarchaeota archaeon]
MKAAILEGPHDIQYLDVKNPTVGPNDILIQVKYVGICGSDNHMYDGSNALISYPITPGHEFSGIVTEFGRDVKAGKDGKSNFKNISVGDLVAIEPTTGCMKCAPCKENKRNLCDYVKIIGCHSDGAMAEYVSVPAYTVHKALKVHGDLEKDALLAALAEPAAVGIHSSRKGNVELERHGNSYFVIGAGIIGIMAANAINYLSDGQKKVFISDLDESRLKIAENLGCANHFVKPRSTNPVDFVEQLSSAGLYGLHNRGFDAVIDAVGAGNSLETAIHLACKESGVIVQLEVSDKPKNILINLKRETTIRGSRVYNLDDFKKGLGMLAGTNLKELFNLQMSEDVPAVKAYEGLENVKEAFESAASGKHLKVMIKIS